MRDQDEDYTLSGRQQSGYWSGFQSSLGSMKAGTSRDAASEVAISPDQLSHLGLNIPPKDSRCG